MVYDYIIENYKEMEPIFISDIRPNSISRSALVQQLTTMCKNGTLKKYDKGIYYIPKKSKLNINLGPNADIVARYKYISNGKIVNGFYSGHTFANQIGLSTQVPTIVEIVSNNCSAKYRDVEIGKRHFIVRKSILPVNSANVYILQLLELLKNIDAYIDTDYNEAKPKIYKFIENHNIKKQDIDQYIRNYPISVFKNYYEMELEHVLA